MLGAMVCVYLTSVPWFSGSRRAVLLLNRWSLENKHVRLRGMEPKGQRLRKDEKDSPLADVLGGLSRGQPLNCVRLGQEHLSPLSFPSFPVPAQSVLRSFFSVFGRWSSSIQARSLDQKVGLWAWWSMGSAVETMRLSTFKNDAQFKTNLIFVAMLLSLLCSTSPCTKVFKVCAGLPWSWSPLSSAPLAGVPLPLGQRGLW